MKRTTAAELMSHTKTFGEAWGEAVTNYARIKAWRNPKSEAQWRASVERYALPLLPTIPVSRIALAGILAVLKPIWWGVQGLVCGDRRGLGGE